MCSNFPQIVFFQGGNGRRLRHVMMSNKRRLRDLMIHEMKQKIKVFYILYGLPIILHFIDIVNIETVILNQGYIH